MAGSVLRRQSDFRRPIIRNRAREPAAAREEDTVLVAETHYQRPGWFTKHVFNRFVALLTRLGLSVWGSRILVVRGRTSGVLRETPVNVLTLDGSRYLVA